MASITCQKLLGYSYKKEYAGSYNHRNVVTLNLETLHPTNATPRYNLSEFSNYEEIIIINDKNLGKGRVISVSEPRSADFQENGLQFWKRNITVEIYYAGDSTQMPADADNTFYSRLNNIINARISSVSENFEFNNQEDGNVSYSHTVSVTCSSEFIEGQNSAQEGVAEAKRVAQLLIASSVDFGYLTGLNIYNSANGKNLFSEEINIIEGTVSITKTFIPSNIRTPISYSFNIDSEGIIEIRESVVFKNKEKAQVASAISTLLSDGDIFINSSFPRCNSIFGIYKEFIDKPTSPDVDGLQNQSLNLISIVKSFNEQSQELSLEITFNNSRSLRAAYLAEILQVLALGKNGIVSCTENANFTLKASKSEASLVYPVYDQFSLASSMKSILDSEQINAKTRILKFCNENFPSANYSANSLKITSSSRSFDSNGKQFSYSIAYTTDTSIKQDNDFVSINCEINFSKPQKNIQSYVIPGTTKPFLHEGNQSTLGTANISLRGKLKRIESNKNSDKLYKPKKQIINLYNMGLINLITRLSSIGLGDPNKFIVTGVNYSYNSERDLNVSISVSYWLPINRLGKLGNGAIPI